MMTKLQTRFKRLPKIPHLLTFAAMRKVGIICTFVVLILAMLSLALGSVNVPLDDVLASLTSMDATPMHKNIILKLRMPRTVTAILGGASLAAAGLLMQTLFRNPLAGPSVLGLSTGASLAVALVIMGGVGAALGPYASIIAAIIGSSAVLLIILAVARRFTDVTTVLIVGLMLGFLTSALVGLLQRFADETSLKAFVFWGMGSFSSISTMQLWMYALPLCTALFLSGLLIKPLDALLLGEMHARSMGIHVGKLRSNIMLLTGVLTGVVTAFCGPIAFIGLTAPHLARMIAGGVSHKAVLPLSMLTGAGLALLCDLIARGPYSPIGLPLNTVCALMGAPVVIYLIFAARRKRWLI